MVLLYAGDRGKCNPNQRVHMVRAEGRPALLFHVQAPGDSVRFWDGRHLLRGRSSRWKVRLCYACFLERKGEKIWR